jgi:hypothetical protein
VVARFDGGRPTSDAGVLLLREVAERTGLLRQFAACITDHRDPALIEHPVAELVSQRVMALGCGYEDLNDHDMLRDDAMLAVAADKTDATGAMRRRARDRGHAVAGKSQSATSRTRRSSANVGTFRWRLAGGALRARGAVAARLLAPL